METRTEKSEFEELAMPYLEMLYGTALRMTHDQADAEDLVQETYLKAFRYFSHFEAGTNFKAWIFKILMNNFNNKYKKDRKTPEQISIEDTPDFYLYDKVADSYGGGISPEEEFLDKFIPEIIKKAVSDLPDDYRIVFILADVNGFSYDDIANVTETNMGTVKSRLFRARRMLQRALWEYAKELGVIPEIPYGLN